MRYLCVHCDHRFEHEQKDPPKRCPACMRKGGLEAIGKAKEAEGEKRGWVVPAAVIGIVAAAAAAYSAFSGGATTSDGEVAMRPLSVSEIEGVLTANNAAGGAFAQLFEPNDAVRALGEAGAEGHDGAVAKARGVATAIAARREAGAFEHWPLDVPRSTAPRRAAGVATRLAREADADAAEDDDASASDDGARMYPLEIAALAVSALRTQGVDAMLAEVWAFEGDTRPPDPSGQFGYFAVAVYEGDVGEGDPTIIDVYGGREAAPAADSSRVLNDVQAVGALLSLDALFRNVQERNPPRAMERIDRALRLDRRAPYARGVRAAVLLSAGSREEAIQEFEAAAGIRDDGPRRLQRASVLIATRDMDAAGREITRALEQFEDYATARAVNGLILMEDGELGRAREELERAERIEPSLSKLPVWFAMLELREGNRMAALAHAREALGRAGLDAQAHLQVAQVFRQAEDLSAMRRAARAALELTPESQQAGMSQLIRQVLGPTALEEEDPDWANLDEPHPDDEFEDDEDWGEDEGGEGGLAGQLQLGGGLTPPPGMGGGLGGGGAPAGGGPSLLGGESLGGGGGAGQGAPGDPVIMMGDPSDYSLGGGSLRLDL